jgi:hypothetical protein
MLLYKLILIFSILVVIYLFMNYKNIHPYEIAIIIIALITLIIINHNNRSLEFTLEHYIDNSQNIALLLDLEENITTLQNIQNMHIYLTAFNKKSYDSGKYWFNIADMKSNGQCESNIVFTFDSKPIYIRRNGLLLGANRLTGPMSNALGIKFHEQYTIMMVCKHNNTTSTEVIELLKLYANSSNNNGLSFYIKSDSL